MIKIYIITILYILTILPLWLTFYKQIKLVRLEKDGLRNHRKALNIVVGGILIDTVYTALLYLSVLVPYVTTGPYMVVKFIVMVAAWTLYYVYRGNTFEFLSSGFWTSGFWTKLFKKKC